MLIFLSLYVTAVFLDKIVIPRSRSRSLESMMRSSTFSFSRNTLLCANMESTSVVFPWSTCAMMAMLRISSLGTALEEISAVCVSAQFHRQSRGQRHRTRASRAARALSEDKAAAEHFIAT